MSWFTSLTNFAKDAVSAVVKYNPYTIAAQGIVSGLQSTGLDQMIPYVANIQKRKDELENQAYQRQLQQQIFAREDTATQRRASDLIAAGLSPTLAAGSAAGAGAVVQSTAPSPGQGNVMDMVPMIMSVMKQKQEIDMSEMQVELIKKQIEKVMSEKNQIDQNTAKDYYNYNWFSGKGLPIGQSNIATQIASALGLGMKVKFDKAKSQLGSFFGDFINKIPEPVYIDPKLKGKPSQMNRLLRGINKIFNNGPSVGGY